MDAFTVTFLVSRLRNLVIIALLLLTAYALPSYLNIVSVYKLPLKFLAAIPVEMGIYVFSSRQERDWIPAGASPEVSWMGNLWTDSI